MSGKEEKKLLLTYEIMWDEVGGGSEPYYFKVIDILNYVLRKYKIDKTRDVFAASEMSSFWGDMARRRGEQEQRAMQMMATLNGMLKDLFKVIRELNIISERLEFYNKSKEDDETADSTLKDIWVSLVEGGTKNPSSVFGLASQVGFVALPDFFFTTFIKWGEEDKIKEIVDSFDVSEKMKYVLARKLRQFCEWRKRTYKELLTRQHFSKNLFKTMVTQVKIYTEWVKPYIRAINKLKNIQKEYPQLVTAYETAVLETDIVATYKNPIGRYVPVIKVKFRQQTMPGEAYQQGYQRGYVHRGRVSIFFEGYVYTKEELKKEKEKETKELIDFLSENVDASIQSFGNDLMKYIGEDFKAELFQEKKEKEEKKEKPKPAAEKITTIFPFLGPLFRKRNGVKFELFNFMKNWEDARNKAEAEEIIKGGTPIIDVKDKGCDLFKLYDIFKVSYGLARIP